jgi:hypothetical protein
VGVVKGVGGSGSGGPLVVRGPPRRHALPMTTPLTTEMPQRLEPVTHDPFIDDLAGLVAPAPPAGAGTNRAATDSVAER